MIRYVEVRIPADEARRRGPALIAIDGFRELCMDPPASGPEAQVTYAITVLPGFDERDAERTVRALIAGLGCTVLASRVLAADDERRRRRP